MGKVLLAMLSLMLLLNTNANGYASEQTKPANSQAIDNIISNLKEKAPGISSEEIKVGTEIEYRILQEKNKFILLMVISAMTIIFMILTLVFISRIQNYVSLDIVHGSGLVLVIQAILFVVVFSPTSEQLTASIGALGAIAGYLFGKITNTAQSEGEKKEASHSKKKS